MGRDATGAATGSQRRKLRDALGGGQYWATPLGGATTLLGYGSSKVVRSLDGGATWRTVCSTGAVLYQAVEQDPSDGASFAAIRVQPGGASGSVVVTHDAFSTTSAQWSGLFSQVTLLPGAALRLTFLDLESETKFSCTIQEGEPNLLSYLPIALLVIKPPLPPHPASLVRAGAHQALQNHLEG